MYDLAGWFIVFLFLFFSFWAPSRYDAMAVGCYGYANEE